jgi:hypothetical protein
MINVEYRLKLGQDEFVIRGDFKNEKEFFQKISFFSSLPKTAPNGATDLKLVVRETKKGKYYSLVSEQEKMEFQLGQHKEGDTLYAKDWVPLFQAQQEQDQDGPAQQASSPINVGYAAQAPVQQRAAAPKAAAAPIVNSIPFPQNIAPIQAPIQQAVPTPVAQTVTAPAANPQVTAVANNVLARFGINK